MFLLLGWRIGHSSSSNFACFWQSRNYCVIKSLPTESENLDSLWEEDDLKVKFFLINKLGIQAVQLVADSLTAFQMMSVLEAHCATNSIQAMVSRFDRLLDMEYRGGSEITAHIPP